MSYLKPALQFAFFFLFTVYSQINISWYDFQAMKLPFNCQVIYCLIPINCLVITKLLSSYCQAAAKLFSSYCLVIATLLPKNCKPNTKLLPSWRQTIAQLWSSNCKVILIEILSKKSGKLFFKAKFLLNYHRQPYRVTHG